MRALLPNSIPEVDDTYLLTRYAASQRPFVRFNFVSSIDGSAQRDGLSGGLGSAGDRRIFSLLRRLADVVLVGAGTVRAEGYAGPLIGDADIAWREAQGLSAQPVLAIVSHGLNLEPEDEVFTLSPVPVLVFTSIQVTEEQRNRFASHVELVEVAEVDHGCDPQEIVADLLARGLGFIHAEGGPHLLGQFIAADQVDSMCVSYSPLLLAGSGQRIAHGPRQEARKLEMHSLFEEESMLFCDYRRPE
ncbi:dihydrofolate reductase family protein [Glutamicibacter arilaitensis]|uniref:dihydrofolate reductase family protein n=1 Tax=Glutamicibacter arilaitensis TaxID=256701 RepID=UPI0038501A47